MVTLIYRWAYVIAATLAVATSVLVIGVGWWWLGAGVWSMPTALVLLPGLLIAAAFPFWLASMIRSSTNEQRQCIDGISQLTGDHAREAWQLTLEGATPSLDGTSVLISSGILRMEISPPASASELASLGRVDASIRECFRQHRSVRWIIDTHGFDAAAASIEQSASDQSMGASRVMYHVGIDLVRAWPGSPGLLIIGHGLGDPLKMPLACDRVTGRAGIYARADATGARAPRLLESSMVPEQDSVWHLMLIIHAMLASDSARLEKTLQFGR